MRGFRKIIVFAILLAVAAGAAAYYTQEQIRTTYIEADVNRGDIVLSVSSVGSFRPIGMVQITSATSGQIAEVNVDFNDLVEKGEPLAVIDRRILIANLQEVEAVHNVALANARMVKAQIARAKADLADARLRSEVARAAIDGFAARHGFNESELSRAQSLAARQSVPASEVERARFAVNASMSDLEVARLEFEVAKMQVVSAEAVAKMAEAELGNAEAAVKQRKAAVDRATVELERATLRAPINGFVVGRSLEVGQTVSAGPEASTLFTLAESLEKMEIHAVVDESDIVQIELGQMARVSVDALPDRIFTGAVKQIRRLSDDRDGVVTFTIVISVENPDLILLPGMTALLDIVVTERRNVLSIPNAALRFRPSSSSEIIKSIEPLDATEEVVWLLDQDRIPNALGVQTGLTDGTLTEIISDKLVAGDQVIVGTRVTREAQGLFGLKLGQ